MKNIKSILIIRNEKTSFIVFEQKLYDIKLFFYDELPINNLGNINEINNQIRSNVNSLLTNAKNFLNYSIKNVIVVFDDKTARIDEITNKKFENISNIAELNGEIYRQAKINKRYVLGVNLKKYDKDDEDYCSCIVSGSITSISYEEYNSLKAIFDDLPIKIENILPISSFLGDSKFENELIIFISKDSLTFRNFRLGKINFCKKYDFTLERVFSSLANQFEIDLNLTKKLLNLANNSKRNDNKLLSLIFTSIYKSMNKISFLDLKQKFVEALKDRIKTYAIEAELSIPSCLKIYSSVYENLFENEKENMFSANKKANLSYLKIDSLAKKIISNFNIVNNKKLSQYQFENIDINELLVKKEKIEILE